jgi:hypothetical protein
MHKLIWSLFGSPIPRHTRKMKQVRGLILITFILKVSTYIITSITIFSIGLPLMLPTMSVSTFIADVIINFRYDFLIKTTFGLSLPPIVCRKCHVLFTLFVFACVSWYSTYSVLCFLFCLSLSCGLYALCCQYLWISTVFIVPLVFSSVYSWQIDETNQINF